MSTRDSNASLSGVDAGLQSRLARTLTSHGDQPSGAEDDGMGVQK